MSYNNSMPKQLFVLRKSTDGVDNTIVVVCAETDLTIAQFAYWEHERRAIKAATAFACALRSMHQDGGYIFGDSIATSSEAINMKYFRPVAWSP